MIKCLIDNSEHENAVKLHGYLRKLKVTQKDYYEKYLPRKDLLTGEPIEFKDYKSYLISDFKKKINFSSPFFYVLKNIKVSGIFLTGF